jgi:hypothetical protein
MRLATLLLAALLLPLVAESTALAQSPGAGRPRIEWEVKNRFRLFRSETDFQRHVASWRNDGALGSERRLSLESDGRGWARDTVERLCVDRAGRLMEFCERDGVREVYLSPGDHRIGVVLASAPPDAVSCVWTFEDRSSEPRQSQASCDEEMRLRIVNGRPTTASVDIVLPDGTAQRVVTEIEVRDLLIAGMGDSIAAGEGNPDRPVRFRRRLLLPPLPRCRDREYYRPDVPAIRATAPARRRIRPQADAWARQRALAQRSVPPVALRLPDGAALALAMRTRASPSPSFPCLLRRNHRRRLSRLARISECPNPAPTPRAPRQRARKWPA